jgi:hypothetical protein
LARAPVDDGVRPGKLSQKTDNKQKEMGKRGNRGAVFEAELPRCWGQRTGWRFSEKRQLAGL